MRVLGLILLTIAPAVAGEYAVLSTGARLHADRHEIDGGKVRLYNGEGYSEFAQALVVSFEADGAVPPTPTSAAAPAPAAPPQPTPQELADAAADKYGLPRSLVRSVMAAESGFAPTAISPKGAVGLMQLMPGTAKTLNVDAADPAQNADAGARYLRDLLVKYDGRLWHALAAYNAGPAVVEKYHGVPPYRETIDYIRRVEKTRLKNEAAQPLPATSN